MPTFGRPNTARAVGALLVLTASACGAPSNVRRAVEPSCPSAPAPSPPPAVAPPVLPSTHPVDDGAWSPQVLELLQLDRRDEALRALVQDNRAAGRADYESDDLGRVKAVTICPQPAGPPLLVVFLAASHEAAHAAPQSGHFMLFDTKGTFVDFQDRNNWLSGHLRDVEADGVMDHVASYQLSLGGVNVQALHVTPMVPPFESKFTLFWADDELQWRLVQPDPSVRPTLQLFEPRRSERVVAEYRYSDADQTWLGPNGSREDGFVVVDGDFERAARTIAEPECGSFAEHVAQGLPEVRDLFDRAGHQARPGALYYPVDEGDFSVALGFQHDDRFEAAVLVHVVKGELSVTKHGQPIALPDQLVADVRRVCSGAP